MIDIDHLTRQFGDFNAVDDLSLSVGAGETLVLLGTSGCGKTTTLRMMNRLVEPDSGTIRIDGKDIRQQSAPDLRRRIGYVIQDGGLFPHYTVAQAIATVPRLLGWSEADIDQRTRDLIAKLQLPDSSLHRYPAELSGGQRQRVGLARALAAEPKVMLLDEPFGALDPLTRDGLGEDYRRLHVELGLTTLMITHDVQEALLLADRIAVMRDGRLVAAGTAGELGRRDADPYVRELMDTPRRQADRVAAKLRGAHDA